MIIRVYNNSSINNINSEYRIIIDELLEKICSGEIIKKIENIRLLGSIPRGNAKKYTSDADFVIIINSKLNNNEMEFVNELSNYLTKKYNYLKDIGIEIEEKDKIINFRKFVFKTDSISLYGDDKYKCSFIDIESEYLAAETTPNLLYLLNTYKKMLLETDDENKIKKISIWIGKDILKSMRGKVIIEYSIYEKEPKNIYNALCKFYSEYKNIFDKLLEVYINPNTNKIYLLTILDDVQKISEKFIVKYNY